MIAPMKHFILMLALVLAIPCTAQNRRSTTTRRTTTTRQQAKKPRTSAATTPIASYEGTFGDDAMGALSSFAPWFGMEAEPNPLAHLKGRHVMVVITFSSLSAPQLTIADSKGKVIEENFSTALEWKEKDKQLTCVGSNYALEVDTKDQPHIALIGFDKKSRRIAHHWDITPTTKSRVWFDIVLHNAHLGMSKLKKMEEGFNTKERKWGPILASFERAFPNAKNYKTVSHDEVVRQETKNKLVSAETLQETAEKNDINSMFMLGQNYHEGRLHGVAKDERSAYKWLIKAYLRANKKGKQTVMDYIQKNLERRKTFPVLTIDLRVQDTDKLDATALYQHPLVVFSIPRVFDNGKKLAKTISARYRWTLSQADKKHITVFGKPHNTLPSLYGERLFSTSWYKNGKKYANYEFVFHFSSFQWAEDFALHYAHDLFREGFNFEEFATSKEENFSLSAEAPYIISGKRYNFQNTIFVHRITSSKEPVYAVNISFTLIKK